MAVDTWTTAAAVLRAASHLVDGIQEGLARRGFDDVRPAHGFAFVLLASGGATTAHVAEHLGITKQAASQLVGALVDRGYVERRPDPNDGRARTLVLTSRGRACTRAAEAAARETVELWRADMPAGVFAAMAEGLSSAAPSGPLRPAW